MRHGAFIDATLLVYLAAASEEEMERLKGFWRGLLKGYDLYTDVLVLDETVWVLRRKYGVPYADSLDFIDSVILPFVRVLPLGLGEFVEAKRVILDYRVKPSDALHIAVMRLNGIKVVVTEDEEFDRIPWMKRIWLA